MNPHFRFLYLKLYPDKVDEEKVDLSKLGNSGFRIYDASRTRENLPPARSVVDLHIEKLTDSWKHLSNFEILTLQLKEFEKVLRSRCITSSAILNHYPWCRQRKITR